MKNSYHHGDLKNALIAAALEIIRTRGVDSLSIRAVAQKTGVSHTAPYRHFSSKEDMLVAIALNGFSLLQSMIDESLSGTSMSPLKSMMTMGKVYLDFAAGHTEQYRIMFGPCIKKKTEMPVFFKAYDREFQRLTALIREHRGDEGDTALTALTVWSLIHGYASFLIDNKGDADKINSRQSDMVLARIARLVDP